MWPYDPARMDDKPPARAYQFAALHRGIDYRKLSQDLDHLKACLAEGYCFVFGCFLYPGFLSSKSSGAIPLPGKGETPIGGHAMVVVGYDDGKRVFNIRNSFGTGWGDAGYMA